MRHTWEALLELFRIAFPLTIVDVGFCLEEDEELLYDQVRLRRNAVARLALQRADLVVAVARADPVGLHAFIRGYQELRDLGVPASRVRLVVNQLRPGLFGGDRPADQVRAALARYVGIEPAAVVPYDRSGVDAALLAGQALREARPGCPAQQALARLAATLFPAPARPRRAPSLRRDQACRRRQVGTMTAGVPQSAEQIVEHEVRELVRRRGLDPGNGDAVEVRRLIDEVVADYAERRLVSSMPPIADAGQVAKAVADRVVGMGPLQPFFDDPDVEEVWINEPGKVFVAKAGRPQLTTTVLSDDHVHDLVELMLRASGRRVDLSSPFVDATLADGSRLHVVIPDITRRHWAVNIRRFVLRAHSLAELVRLGTMSGQCASFLEAAVVAGLNIVVAGGTGKAWANPQPAETPRRLALEGGFVVDGGRDRRLEERARWHGFEDLRGYLQARCDAGHSVPRIAAELEVRDWQVGAALARLGVRLAPRQQRLAQQRRRYTEQRIAARVAALGFADVGVYLADRVVQRGWLLAEVATELAAHRLTVRRLLDRHGILRVRRTPAERAAAESGRRVQAVGWQARRAARLAELGFADLAGYLKARYVEQGFSVSRMRAELQVGRRWLVGEMGRLGLRP